MSDAVNKVQLITIVGSSGHARVVLDILRLVKQSRVAGLIDPFRKLGECVDGIPVIGREEDLPHLCSSLGLTGFVVGVGDNHLRAQIFERVQLSCPGLLPVTAIHPSAVVARSSHISAGAVVAAAALVGPGARIGRCCILNTASSLDHDSELDDFASMAPGARTGGDVHIGRFTAIGMGAVVLHGVRIGEQSVVGASSLVTQDVEPSVVTYGVPARMVRTRNPGDRYL